jgi:hypothetical protein
MNSSTSTRYDSRQQRRGPLFGTLLAAMVGSVLLLTQSAPPVHAQQNRGRAAAYDPTVDVVAGGKGRINYDKGVVKATGYGVAPARASSPAQAKLMALGAARADALRTLAMTVSSIQVTATTKVKNYELQSDKVETKLSALLQSPRVVSEAMQPDGTAVVVMELPMYGPGSVASVIFPEVLPSDTGGAAAGSDAIDFAAGNTVVTGVAAPSRGAGANSQGEFVGPAQPAVRVSVPAPRPIPSLRGPEPGPTPLSDNGPFTSLLVDCRGLSIEAIMSPKLLDTTGREVYGTIRVTAEYAIDTGIVGYPRSMAEALHTARAGAHPLIVKGLRAGDKHRFNPVISLEDADRVLAANNRDHFLEQTRVIFLVDPVR